MRFKNHCIRPCGFNTHQHQPQQLGIKLPQRCRLRWLQSHLYYLTRHGIQHRQHPLLASVQITSYLILISGSSLRSELC